MSQLEELQLIYDKLLFVNVFQQLMYLLLPFLGRSSQCITLGHKKTDHVDSLLSHIFLAFLVSCAMSVFSRLQSLCMSDSLSSSAFFSAPSSPVLASLFSQWGHSYIEPLNLLQTLSLDDWCRLCQHLGQNECDLLRFFVPQDSVTFESQPPLPYF